MNKWHKYKEEKPKEYGYYILLKEEECNLCDKKITHEHILNFVRHKYDIGLWEEGEASNWFSETRFLDEEITYWMSFKNKI